MFMKKVLFCASLLCAAILGNAQSTVFKPFKVDFATGYAIPGGSGSKGGVLFAIEPKYALNDNITVGIRFEGAVMARATTVNGQEFTGDVKASGSYLATGDYYFNTNKFRPFAGVGVGIYNNASGSFSSGTNTGTIEGGTVFGGAPRAGFEFGHFRMAVEYNLMGKSGTINNNYLGIKLGFFAGGGRTGK
jgi:hypothetical protein